MAAVTKQSFVFVALVGFIYVMQANGPGSTFSTSEMKAEREAEEIASAEASGDAWAVARAKAGKQTRSDASARAYGTSSSSSGTGGQVTFDAGPGGHFYTAARVQGASVDFLIDTGATSIVLTEADARKVGIPFHRGEFRVVGQQVSGTVRGKPVTLRSVTVGGKTVRDVQAVIIEGATMNLLGQSFLTRAGRIEMDGQKMVLR